MARQKTERMGKEVKAEVLRILREGVNDPTLQMRTQMNWPPNTCEIATQLLVRAGYVTPFGFERATGYITLAGMDYYRQETKRFTWLRANGFPVFVAVLTSVATLGAGIITVWFSNRPC